MARRVNILQVPGPNDEAWRHSIAQQCYAHGWRYYEHWGSTKLDIDPEVDCVVIAWSRPEEMEADAVWLVQSCAPEDAIRALMDRFGATADEAPIHVSNRYLFATDLALAGAPVSTLYDTNLQIPDLGSVKNPTPSCVQPADANGLLSLYNSIPPRLSSMSWPASCLDYSESTLVIRNNNGVLVQLAGRRRILTQGPHISLPRGRWRVNFQIALDTHGPTVLRFEWGDAEIEETLQHSGVYEISLAGYLDENVLANIKTMLIVPKLDGEITFGDLIVNPADAATPHQPL